MPPSPQELSKGRGEEKRSKRERREIRSRIRQEKDARRMDMRSPFLA
jgi:hypothetical protein